MPHLKLTTYEWIQSFSPIWMQPKLITVKYETNLSLAESDTIPKVRLPSNDVIDPKLA